MNDRLVKFYLGICTDNANRSFVDMLSFSNKQLESKHDYIQWL